MSDRLPERAVAVWIALRRAHQGGIANLNGRWLDFGRPVPSYVADALDGLTIGAQVALGDTDPESCGVRRAIITDSGRARYLALCQVHNAPGGRSGTTTPVAPATHVSAASHGPARTCPPATRAADMLTPVR